MEAEAGETAEREQQRRGDKGGPQHERTQHTKQKWEDRTAAMAKQ